MARMYPSPMPLAAQNDPGRAAERRVYEAIERDLDDGFSVFYGVAWLAKHPAGRARDGEADFVVTHARHGILILEVKGGRIARDGRTGTWVSLDRHGEAHRIDDPLAQLRGAKYALLEKIKAVPAWGQRWVELGHGLVLPDSGAPPAPLAPDAPADIVVFAEQMEGLGRRVREIFAYWRGRQERLGELGAEGVAMLSRLLAPSFELRTPLGAVLAEDDREILRLTEEQFRVLDMLARQRRVAISGGAGTGKTVLALEKAKRLAREGFRVLLTCFNRPLADFLERSAGQAEGLQVMTFHQLCYRFAREAGVPLADPGTAGLPSAYFEQTLPESLLAALDRLPWRYDAIIVDEGQDFLEGWWDALQLCLADPAVGILYVFFDDNQQIYRRVASFPGEMVEIALTENHRNTRAIHAVASRFYRGGELRPLGPEGRAVEVVPVRSREAIEREVSRLLHRLLREERVAADDVAVLTGRTARLAPGGHIGATRATADQDQEPGRVLLQTIHRFKGLERRVVILAEIDGLPAEERDALLYVGLSRARTYLAIVATRDTLAQLGFAADAPGAVG